MKRVPVMMPHFSDRNLVLGVLALQMNFVTRDQLVGAMNGWMLDKTRSLGDVLHDQGVLSGDRKAMLDAVVHEHFHPRDTSDRSYATAAPITASPPEVKQTAPPRGLPDIPQTVAPRRDSGITSTSPTPSSSSSKRFRILRHHARGGLGEVLVAADEELHREVALKQIQDRHADDAESRTRFVQEAEITGGLEHPGIVPVYSLGRYPDGRPFYAMRFIRGDSLKDAIDHYHRPDRRRLVESEQNLELRNLLNRFVDVCQAMAYAHSRGILHRDLKPGNIMLGKYGETLVVDWGLAKPIDEVESVRLPDSDEMRMTPSSMHSATPTLMGSAVGTPQFMSPEQAAGRVDKLGPASDIYSLGATLYNLLTGRPPFLGSDLKDVLLRVERGEFPRPRRVRRDLPPALEAICLKAMAARPEDRYGTARQLADDVEQWLADEPVSAYAEPLTVRAGRWLRRHRTLATGAVTAILVAAMGLAVATGLLTAANEREREAKEEALTQKARAEDNFKLARQAVDTYHTEVSESFLLQEPGMQPLRKKLLEAAREFYDKFVQESGDNPNIKSEFGKALYRLGRITGDIDSKTRGIEYLERAQQVFAGLGVAYQDDLARCHHELGRLYRVTNKLDRSRAEYEKAQSLWRAVVDGKPAAQAELARTQLGLGNVLQVQRHLKQSRDEYQKALAAWEKLAAASARPELQRDLSITHSNLAMVLNALGDRQRAQDHLASAVKMQEKLVQDFPSTSKYQDDLARSHYNRGNVSWADGNLPAAQAAYEAAADLLEDAVKSQPAVFDYQTRLAEVYSTLALLLGADKQLARAIDVANQALTVQRRLAEKNSDQPSYRNDVANGHLRLGNVYRNAGQPAQAEKEYREAATIQDQLLPHLQKVPGFQVSRASTRYSLGTIQHEQKRFKLAEEALGQAVQIWDELRRGPAEVHEARAGLLAAFRARAEARSALKAFTGALDDWNQALALAEERQRPSLRILRAADLARGGLHARALDEAQQLAPLAKGGGNALYLLAQVYALAAGDPGAGDTDKLADHALSLLGQAKNLGFFQNDANRNRLKTDWEWSGVRDRPEFTRFVEDIEKK